jgi:hypothetical protein
VANRPPTADANGPYQVNRGEVFALDASGSSDPDDNIVLYEWDLDNDGEYDDAAGVSPRIIFFQDGTYPIGLQVTDAYGASDTDWTEVQIGNVPPDVTQYPTTRSVQYSDGIADAKPEGLRGPHPSQTVESGDRHIFATVAPATPLEAAEFQIDVLQDIIDSNPSAPQADNISDARDKAQVAAIELGKEPPDNQAAAGYVERAVGGLEAATADGLLDPDQGALIMDVLVGVNRQLAVDALDEAFSQQADSAKIAEAEQELAEGDVLRAEALFGDAAAAYKDALAAAEGALP